LGELKYRQGSIERAEDYFYKILTELEKIMQNGSQKNIDTEQGNNGMGRNNKKPSLERK
jgi:hypothetical protein